MLQANAAGANGGGGTGLPQVGILTPAPAGNL